MSSDTNRMRTSRITLPFAVAGTMLGIVVALVLFLASDPQPAGAKVGELSARNVAVLDNCDDSGSEWTSDQYRLITTAAARLAGSTTTPPRALLEPADQPDAAVRAPRLRQKIPSPEDAPSPH